MSRTKPINKASPAGRAIFAVSAERDPMLARERRNIGRVHNPALRRGQRACHHGYLAPHHMWVSRLAEMMEEYDRTHRP